MKTLISLTFLLLVFSVSTLAQDNAILFEAEQANTLGSDFNVLEEDGVTYITAGTDLLESTFPGSADKVASFVVEFAAPGTYELYVKLRVGPGSFDDDSFFFANSFGEKVADQEGDWIRVNSIGNGAAADDAYIISPEENIAGNEIFKWVNASQIGEGDPGGTLFVVEAGNLTQTFQIGSRENGLDIDKIAFGNADLFYTVSNLENEESGVAEIPEPDKTDPIAIGQAKFLGSAWGPGAFNFDWHWNQITPGNAGKWGSVEATRDVMDWSDMDFVYNLAKDNGFYVKFHVLVWGNQQPAWIENLTPTEQLEEIQEWFTLVAERYPDLDAIEVVNEPLHDPPNQPGNGGGNYIEALGGNGTTGWDWIITAFEMARNTFPASTQLMINDYGIINDAGAVNDYLEIINLLIDRDLIDQIGIQGHAFNLNNAQPGNITANINALGNTGLPVFVTELDLDGFDDLVQLERFQRTFPPIWENEHVEGVTVWGYTSTDHWRADQGAYLINPDGSLRPSLVWLRAYVEGNFAPVTDLTISSMGNVTTIDTQGGSLQLMAEFTPAMPTITDILWTSSNEDIATVDENGLVTAQEDGTVTITAWALDGSGESDSFNLTIENQSAVTGLEKAGSFKLYPNPANDHIAIALPDASQMPAALIIYDQTGRLINSTEFSSDKMKLNISQLPPGLYLLRVEGKTKIYRQKLTVD